MNIIVRTASGRVHVRPDNTLDRYSRDFYVPDGIDTISLSPVVFARITRPGKCIGRKFASRYYQDCGMGVLLYPEELACEGPEGFADAIRLDQSSILPDVSVGLDGDEFRVCAGGKEIFIGPAKADDIIADAISDISVLTLVRTGDLVAVELTSRIPVWKRSFGNIKIMSKNGEKEVSNFIIQ